MIFAEVVFGRSGANWAVTIEPISLRAQETSSLRRSSEAASPSIRMT